MRFAFTAMAVVLAAPAGIAAAQAGPAPAATGAALSVESTEVGRLLDDPAARAVLAEHVPDLVGSDAFSAWRGLTLRGVQKLVGPSLRDEQLDAIQAGFDALARK